MNDRVSGKGSGEAVHLRLYVAGNAPNSMAARNNLAALLASCDPGAYVLEVIDCLVEPARTLQDGIVVTPTLLKLDPQPRATVIGTLSDREDLRSALGLGHE
jgi:circadian clock protein KaiB